MSSWNFKICKIYILILSLTFFGRRLFVPLKRTLKNHTVTFGLTARHDSQNHWFLEEIDFEKDASTSFTSFTSRKAYWFSLICLESTNTTASVFRRLWVGCASLSAPCIVGMARTVSSFWKKKVTWRYLPPKEKFSRSLIWTFTNLFKVE